MVNQRDIIDLLKLMRSRHDLFTSGLCMWTTDLWMHDLVSEMEYMVLISFISENRPDTRHIVLFYWPKGDIEPRLKWIDKQIERLKKNKLK